MKTVCSWCGWVLTPGRPESQISHGICPECAYREFGLKSCGCPEHADRCQHCWLCEEYGRDSYDDGAETYIVTTYVCRTCGELFDRERPIDAYEREEMRLDALEAKAEIWRDHEREIRTDPSL